MSLSLVPHWLREVRHHNSDTRDLENALSSHMDRLRDLTVQLEREIADVKSSGVADE